LVGSFQIGITSDVRSNHAKCNASQARASLVVGPLGAKGIVQVYVKLVPLLPAWTNKEDIRLTFFIKKRNYKIGPKNLIRTPAIYTYRYRRRDLFFQTTIGNNLRKSTNNIRIFAKIGPSIFEGGFGSNIRFLGKSYKSIG